MAQPVHICGPDGREPRYNQPRFGVFGVLDDVSGFTIGILHNNWSDADKLDRGPILCFTPYNRLLCPSRKPFSPYTPYPFIINLFKNGCPSSRLGCEVDALRAAGQ